MERVTKEALIDRLGCQDFKTIKNEDQSRLLKGFLSAFQNHHIIDDHRRKAKKNIPINIKRIEHMKAGLSVFW